MYVIYHKETTLILGGHRAKYATEGAAKTALTKAVNAGKVNREEYAIANDSVFHKEIEKQHEVTNLMSGTKVMEPVNTPNYLSVGSETYWST